MELPIFGGKITEVMCHFHHWITRGCFIISAWLGSLGWGGFCWAFLLWDYFPLSPFPRCTPWKEGAKCNLWLRSGKFCLLEGRVSIYIIWNSAAWKFDSFFPIYLYIHFIIYSSRDSCLFIFYFSWPHFLNCCMYVDDF